MIKIELKQYLKILQDRKLYLGPLLDTHVLYVHISLLSLNLLFKIFHGLTYNSRWRNVIVKSISLRFRSDLRINRIMFYTISQYSTMRIITWFQNINLEGYNRDWTVQTHIFCQIRYGLADTQFTTSTSRLHSKGLFFFSWFIRD